jgi:hypothetical protein
MHDWTRIPPGIYHDFHGGWIYAIRGALNSGLLPKGYYALAEQVTRTIGPDVLTLHNPAANGHSNDTDNGAPKGSARDGGGVAVSTTLPKAQIEAKADRIGPPANRQISIRHVSDHRMVAMIELVSPGNKASVQEFDSFVGKARMVLNEGIHLIVIDPFPPTKRDPNGIHAAIWDAMTGKPFSLPADKPLTLASYYSGEEDDITAYVDPIAVGDVLPDKPLFLSAERHVNVPLEATYMAAWQTFPAEWRNILTGESG